MQLKDSYKAARMIESLENYSISTDNSLVESNVEVNKDDSFYQDYLDQTFWEYILNAPDSFWGKTFTFYQVTLSDWVPRVPGLFFAKGSKEIRDSANNWIEFQSPGWTEFKPQGKSGKVLGGIGTIILPQDQKSGDRMMSLSHSCNASAGIPVLISNDVWEKNKLAPGDTLVIYDAKWIELSTKWVDRFPSIAGIPRGCIALLDINQKIYKADYPSPVQAHPFSVMQYEFKNALLYDYVYMTIDNLEENYRKKIKDFFEKYRVKEGRRGEYLIEIDMNNPLLGAIYNSPEELKKTDKFGKSELSLITKRIRRTYFKGNTIVDLIDFITQNYVSADDLFTLCRLANIKTGSISGNSAAERAASLVNYCIPDDNNEADNNNMIEQLIDAIAMANPGVLK